MITHIMMYTRNAWYNILLITTPLLFRFNRPYRNSNQIEHVGRAEIISSAGAVCLDEVGVSDTI